MTVCAAASPDSLHAHPLPKHPKIHRRILIESARQIIEPFPPRLDAVWNGKRAGRRRANRIAANLFLAIDDRSVSFDHRSNDASIDRIASGWSGAGRAEDL